MKNSRDPFSPAPRHSRAGSNKLSHSGSICRLNAAVAYLRSWKIPSNSPAMTCEQLLDVLRDNIGFRTRDGQLRRAGRHRKTEDRAIIGVTASILGRPIDDVVR